MEKIMFLHDNDETQLRTSTSLSITTQAINASCPAVSKRGGYWCPAITPECNNRRKTHTEKQETQCITSLLCLPLPS